MGNEKSVLSVIEKLNKSKKPATSNNNTNSNYVDYKKLNEEKKAAFTKCAPGKTSFVFLVPEGADDPFTPWSTHAGLLEQAFWTIDCNHENNGENCLICNIVNDLKQMDFEKNKPIFNPIKVKTDYYATVINIESEKTIAEGPKWLKVSKTVIDQMAEWLGNLEEGELPFYSDEEPQKIIINYDDAKSTAPKDKYKVDKKNTKAFSEEQLAEWRSKIKPLKYYMESSFKRSEADIKKLVDAYLARTMEQIETAEDISEEVNHEVEQVKTEQPASGAASKLKGLKKGE